MTNQPTPPFGGIEDTRPVTPTTGTGSTQTAPLQSAMDATPIANSVSYYTKVPVETVDGPVHDFVRTEDFKKIERELAAANRALEAEREQYDLLKLQRNSAWAEVNNLKKDLEAERTEMVKLTEDCCAYYKACIRLDEFTAWRGVDNYERIKRVAAMLTRERDVRRQLAGAIEAAEVFRTPHERLKFKGDEYKKDADKRMGIALAASRALDREAFHE